jgi:hypothetical protein
VQHLSLIAHGMADTLITPINDSLLDLDVLVAIERSDLEPRPSVYAETVRRALDARRKVSGRATDWIVVRNRMESVQSNNQRQISRVLDVIRSILGFRIARGLFERPVYREFFASGLTVFDPVEAAESSSPSNFIARVEVQNLIRELGLIVDQEGLEEEPFREIELEMAEANNWRVMWSNDDFRFAQNALHVVGHLIIRAKHQTGSPIEFNGLIKLEQLPEWTVGFAFDSDEFILRLIGNVLKIGEIATDYFDQSLLVEVYFDIDESVFAIPDLPRSLLYREPTTVVLIERYPPTGWSHTPSCIFPPREIQIQRPEFDVRPREWPTIGMEKPSDRQPIFHRAKFARPPPLQT